MRSGKYRLSPGVGSMALKEMPCLLEILHLFIIIVVVS